MWKKRTQIILWCVFGAATLLLLVSAMQTKEHKACTGVDINVSGADDHVFVNETYINNLLSDAGAKKGNDVSIINVRQVEEQLKKNPWIKDAQLFFDNNKLLHANISEREPLARIFTIQGTSFYIDSSCLRLPLSNEETARVPVFTSFPSSNKTLASPDSAVLQDVKQIASYIQCDSFWMAQIAQIDITPRRTYEMIPVIGDQVIKLGDAENLDEKFLKLYSFYKQVFAKYGFEKYETIDVQYAGQVIASRRGAPKPMMDSAKAMQAFSSNEDKLDAVLKDTAYAAPIIKVDTTAVKDVNKKPVIQNKAVPKTTPPAKSKPKTVLNNKKAKAVLPKKNKS